MKALVICIFIILFSLKAFAQFSFEDPVKQRVLVLTDITNEPDDQESLVRFLVYANEYDVEGLVATTSTHLRKSARKDKILELLTAYEKIKPNLEKHSSGFPEAKYLRSVTAEHLPLYSMEGVGEGKDSPGSELIIRAVDKNDPRPLWISVWGGANCLAQALYKVQKTRSSQEVEDFISKIKVYSISDQDLAGPWIRNNFPSIFYIVDPSGERHLEYYKATWTGISGDKFYKNGQLLQKYELVDNPWLKENIRENHGPLGEYYLKFDYIMEGDTPSFLGLIQNGLGWYKSPAYGGWGGRYDYFKSYAEKGKIWTSSVDTQDEITLDDGRKEASNQATIWRWREAYQNDFAARMDWNVKDKFEDANHNPVLSINGNKGNAIVKGYFSEGQKVSISAIESKDPDGHEITYKWFIYKEISGISSPLNIENANTSKISFIMPKIKNNTELHLILEAKDNGSPSLFSYRRIILKNLENE
jgi:hypothetical protein